jgi:hypothetical protein
VRGCIAGERFSVFVDLDSLKSIILTSRSFTVECGGMIIDRQWERGLKQVEMACVTITFPCLPETVRDITQS